MTRLKTNYMTLEFHAARHNLRVGDLSWAILEISDDCECWRLPILKIKGREAIIDIEKDIYTEPKYIAGRRAYDLLDAKLKGKKLVSESWYGDSPRRKHICIVDLEESVGRHYQYNTFVSLGFKPYKLDLAECTSDNIASFLEKESTIEFFANRFWIYKEQLSWGVIKVCTDDDTWIFPAILVNNGDYFIDLYENTTGYCSNVYGRRFYAYYAYIEDGKIYYKDSHDGGFDKHLTLDCTKIWERYFSRFIR